MHGAVALDERPPVPAPLFGELEARLGAPFIAERRGREHARAQRFLSLGRTGGGMLRHPLVWATIQRGLRVTGLAEVGRRAAAAVELRTNVVTSARLPAAFDGWRVLHLSDLHAEISQDALVAVRRLIAGLDYDLCVLTGDYRDGHEPALNGSWQAMRGVVDGLRGPAFASLGNHDVLDLVPLLESNGVRCLINESVVVEADGQFLHIAGVDDAAIFKTHDLERALARVPADAFTLLLSHSPEPWREAAAAGVDLMLSGHTHGGQVCLPGGFALSLMADVPRRLGRGPWRHGDMQGYTSAGCGTGGLTLRLNCPPEITLHVLRRPIEGEGESEGAGSSDAP